MSRAERSSVETSPWGVRPASASPPGRSKKLAREIRVAWTEGLLWQDGTPCNGGLWHLDQPANRARLEHAVQNGRRLFGATSHWLEERDA